MTKTRKRISRTIAYAIAAVFMLCSCNKGETYADLKKKEKDGIERFIQGNQFMSGRINVIKEDQFRSQGNMTDNASNQFVLFEDNGVYMQIVRRGEGKTMEEMARQQADSTITKTILCRFFEYNILSGETTCSNTTSSICDKLQCKYSLRSRTYEAAFTEGYMKSSYPTNVAVPLGWLIPLDYLRLIAKAGGGEVAKVKIIVPHSSGHSTASSSVTPYYYEITYQLGN